MKHLVSSCTKYPINEFNNTPLGESFKKLNIENTLIHYNNTNGLSKQYNKSIEYGLNNNYDSLILIHDDVYLLDAFYKEKIEECYSNFDILGVAGSTSFNIDTNPQSIAWHTSANSRNDWRGGCFHPKKDKEQSLGEVFFTPFGDFNCQCITIDGLFIAINLNKIGNLRFDEDFNFHFYDLTFSINAYKKGLKTGICPIAIQHMSHGKGLLSEEYKKIQEKFYKKYKK